MEQIPEIIRARLEEIISKLQYKIDDCIYVSVSDIEYSDISVRGRMIASERLSALVTRIMENVFPIADEEIEHLFNFVSELMKECGDFRGDHLIKDSFNCNMSFCDDVSCEDAVSLLNEALDVPLLHRMFRREEYIERYKECFVKVAKLQARQLFFEHLSTQIKFKEQQLLSNVAYERESRLKEVESVELRLKEQEREARFLREDLAVITRERDSLRKEVEQMELRLKEQEREARHLREDLTMITRERESLRKEVEQVESHLKEQLCEIGLLQESEGSRTRCRIVTSDDSHNACISEYEDVFDKDVQNALETCVICTPGLLEAKAVSGTGNDKDVCDRVYSSVFAPAEVKRKSHLLTQIYLHLYDDSEKVISLSRQTDRNTERRDYVPLSVNIRRGTKVDVEFRVYGETELMSRCVSLIWQGDFLKFSFDYFVPQNIDVEELCCEAVVFVNGMMVGEMRFVTRIVENPKTIAPKIVSHCYKKIFISYAHEDAQQVKFIATAYKAQGVDFFYDSRYLSPGDVYNEEIFDYIDKADLFILCWSKNAASSKYVAREVECAMQHAYPQVCKENATIKIYPLNIEPYADLPDNILKVYHYGIV